jgi:hypothetical protein
MFLRAAEGKEEKLFVSFIFSSSTSACDERCCVLYGKPSRAEGSNQDSRTLQHRQTGHKMIIDRNKILKYRDIKAIRRMLEVMSRNIHFEAVLVQHVGDARSDEVCRTKEKSLREIEIQVK